MEWFRQRFRQRFLQRVRQKILNRLPLLERMTFRRRIMLLFMFSTLVPFICLAWLSYHTMTTILESKLEESVENNLKQVRLALETTLSNLNHISQQLAFQGNVGKNLAVLLTSDDPFERVVLTETIKTELNLITFTNPSIGLTMYYFQDDNHYMFNNAGLKPDFDMESLPLLAEYYRVSYFGPHPSLEKYNEQKVLSVLRKVDWPGEYEDLYVYIESGFQLTQNILDNRIGQHSIHLILDNDLRIAFSEMESRFPVNAYFHAAAQADSGLLNDYYWFKTTSNQGWSIVSLIPIAEYNKEKNRWVVQMLYLCLLFGVISLILAGLLWKMVYKPLQQFNHEIRMMAHNRFQRDETYTTSIPEFQFLLQRFRNMREQIVKLIKEVELKEKRRADLEVEKLLYQINPHFLMNTLDTAHWLAVMNGQKEIDRLISSLNKLLYYNLGKLGEQSTIREEIDSLRQYLILQQIRYDFAFDVRMEVDDDVLNVPTPRFILQPIVENALYHGLRDDGCIRVEVKKADRGVEIGVHDNGKGMTETEIEHMLNEEAIKQRKTGMGIGMNYVKRMIENQYGDEAELEVVSEVGKGTSVYLRLPLKQEGFDDSRADCG
jgi:two-component system sensor histidine kinase YesM